jgi:hypothetical protein
MSPLLIGLCAYVGFNLAFLLVRLWRGRERAPARRVTVQELRDVGEDWNWPAL